MSIGPRVVHFLPIMNGVHRAFHAQPAGGLCFPCLASNHLLLPMLPRSCSWVRFRFTMPPEENHWFIRKDYDALRPIYSVVPHQYTSVSGLSHHESSLSARARGPPLCLPWAVGHAPSYLVLLLCSLRGVDEGAEHVFFSSNVRVSTPSLLRSRASPSMPSCLLCAC